MERKPLPEEFKEFIQLLNSEKIEYFISKTDLIANKKASGRPKDMIDVDALE